MLSWSVIFFAIAILAALLGFTGIAAGAAWIAQVIFVVFIIAFAVGLIRDLARERRPPPGR